MPKLRVIIKPPPEPQGDAEQQTEALRDYLLQMSEELAYVLTHLEADNINDSTFERIQSMIPRPYTGLPVMDGDASSGQSEQWARGDHRHGHDSSKADVTALEAEAAAREAHEADTNNPHEVTKAQVGLGDVANERQYSAQNPPPIPTPGEVGAIPATEKGSAGGVAELDSNGMVPSAQLPSYVDDVLEYASLSAFPVTGESGKIYVALDTGRTYRWSGSAYVEISESLALGETASTAYRGDRGKTAYDHSQVTSGNPHNVSAYDVGLGNVANERQYSAQNPPPLPTPADIGAATAQDLTDHVGDTNNPHGVTAAQVGVVPNPADPATDTLTKMQVGSTVYEITGGGGGGPEPATATPLMDGTGAVGSSLKYAREDHEHPADTNKQSKITASGILKGDGAGGVSAATAGTDYQAPLTAGTDYATPAQLADKAEKADLTNIQATGTTNTTGAVIPAGAYFYLNGVLHRAKTQIDVNATFTVNTNCEQATEGGLNDIGVSISTIAEVSGNTTIQIGGYYKIGYVVIFTVAIRASKNLVSGDNVCQGLPSVRANNIALRFYNNNSQTFGDAILVNTGVITLKSSVSSGQSIRLTGAYIA